MQPVKRSAPNFCVSLSIQKQRVNRFGNFWAAKDKKSLIRRGTKVHPEKIIEPKNKKFATLMLEDIDR